MQRSGLQIKKIFGYSLTQAVVFVGIGSMIICVILFISSIASLSIEPVNKSATLGMNIIFTLVSSSLSCYQIVISSLLLYQAIKLKGNAYICSVWAVSHYSIIAVYLILFGGKFLIYMYSNQILKAVLILIAGVIYEALQIYGTIIVNSYAQSLGQDRYY